MVQGNSGCSFRFDAVLPRFWHSYLVCYLPKAVCNFFYLGARFKNNSPKMMPRYFLRLPPHFLPSSLFFPLLVSSWGRVCQHGQRKWPQGWLYLSIYLSIYPSIHLSIYLSGRAGLPGVLKQVPVQDVQQALWTIRLPCVYVSIFSSLTVNENLPFYTMPQGNGIYTPPLSPHLGQKAFFREKREGELYILKPPAA